MLQLFRMAALTLLIYAVVVPEVTAFTPWSQEMIYCMEGCMDNSKECTEECQTDGFVDDCTQKRCVGGMRACRRFCFMTFGGEAIP
ncbi:hypothetical protein LSAT2_019753 [Lamellibrachia satsuma]|nr:hypothetical protein LSAT2_019753 [Lamellibrachia satsuma]